jgi:putative ABC transport system permease protein
MASIFSLNLLLLTIKTLHMLKNYIRTAFRSYSLRRKTASRPFFTYINLLGLTIGLAAFLVVAHLVRYELSFDKHISNNSSLYRVAVERKEGGQTTLASARTYPGVGYYLKNGIAEVESFARVLKEECMLHFKENDIKFNGQLTYWCDKSFISMFGLKLVLTGDTAALDNPNTCLLSRTAAERFFGKNWEGLNSPVGKTIHLNESLPFMIQGVYEDFPANSHMEADCVLSYATLIKEVTLDFKAAMPPFYNATYTYLLLRPGTDPRKIESQAQQILSQNIPATVQSSASYNFSLQPVPAIHLNSHLADELKPNGNSLFVTAMIIAAGLILLVAWINFINLATARAMHRAKEVGVRKAIGATKKQLVHQFIVEALLASLLAATGAIIIILCIANSIKNMLDIKGAVFSWQDEGLWYWLMFIAIIFVGGLLSSIYPAAILSSFKPVLVLKGKAGGKTNKGYLRKGLITFQFFFAILLLTCTAAIYYQVKYMRSQPLGMNTEQVLVLHSPRSLIGNPKRVEYFKSFRQELLKDPAIETVGASGCIPGDEFLLHWEGITLAGVADEKDVTYDVAWVNEGYLPSLGFKILAGSNFADRPGEDTKVIINETAMHSLGIAEPSKAIGRTVRRNKNKEYQIGAVVADAHYEGLQQSIRPLLLFFGHNYEFGYFTAKINTAALNQTIAHVQNQWKDIYPNDPLDYFFLDSFFDEQYKSDRRFGKVFGIFSFLAIFIACLGLFGLIAFTTHQKVKEIGIRKVLGASIAGIVGLLTGEFLKPILIACLIAIPVNHLLVTKWLDTFAYRFSFNWWMHLLPVALILLLAFFALGWQAVKAAVANPMNALREE